MASSSASRSADIAEKQYNIAMQNRQEAQALANSKKTNALYSFQGKTTSAGIGDIGAIKKRDEGGSGISIASGMDTLGLISMNKKNNTLGG